MQADSSSVPRRVTSMPLLAARLVEAHAGEGERDARERYGGWEMVKGVRVAVMAMGGNMEAMRWRIG